MLVTTDQMRAIDETALARGVTAEALDGLLGIGASGSPREPIASAITRLNTLRRAAHTFVFAADIPSGLDANTGQPEHCTSPHSVG